MSNLIKSADFARGRTEGAADLAAAVEPISRTMQRWDDERALERTDPVLARLLRAEAVAGRRAENQQCEAAKLVLVHGLIREAIIAHTGRPFANPLYPENEA